MPADIRNVWTFLKLHRFLFAYLFIVAAVVCTLVRVQVNEDARNRDQVRVNQIVCVQASDTRESIIRLIDSLTQATPHIPNETPEAAARIDGLNAVKLQTREKARAELTPPTCLVELGLDADQDGKPDVDKLPRPFGPPK